MSDHTRLMPVLSLLPLPEVAQQLIARSGSVDARQALAASPHTTDSVINLLAEDPDRVTHHSALRRCTDQDLLHARLARNTTCCAANVLRNPVTGPDRLDAALSSSDNRVKLAAYVNAATPAASRAAIEPSVVTSMVDVGEPIGDTVVRSHEALLANRGLLSRMDQFGNALRRAAFALADLTVDEHEQLRILGRPGRYGLRHPVARTRRGAAAMDADELLALNSPAADLWIALAPSTDAALARRTLARRDHHVEPHVIARLLHRFGPQCVPGGSGNTIATTRVDSTAWSNPMGRFYNEIARSRTDGTLDQLTTAVETLGTDRRSWESFLTLLVDWEGTPDSLAQSARSL